MNHVPGVGEVEGLGQGSENKADLFEENTSPLTHELAERLARNILEDGKRVAVVKAVVVYRGDGADG